MPTRLPVSIHAMRMLLLTCWLLAMANSSVLAASELRQTQHLQSRLVVAQTTAQPGSVLTVGLLLEHDPHWHTYWRNPGDSGLKTEIELSVPAGVQVSGIDWPAPERFPLSETIVNFGYSGRTLLPVRLSVPANFAGDRLLISAKARWLICESECIPGTADYALSVPVQATGTPQVDEHWRSDFARSALRQPQPSAIEAVLRADNDGALLLTLAGADVPSELASWTLFPLAEELISYSVLPRWQLLAGSWQTPLKRSDYFAGLPTRSDWLLVKGDRALLFTAQAEDRPASAVAKPRN